MLEADEAAQIAVPVADGPCPHGIPERLPVLAVAQDIRLDAAPIVQGFQHGGRSVLVRLRPLQEAAASPERLVGRITRQVVKRIVGEDNGKFVLMRIDHQDGGGGRLESGFEEFVGSGLLPVLAGLGSRVGCQHHDLDTQLKRS